MIAAARDGDNNSFELLAKRYEKQILVIALRITRNWHDAEDAKQKSFQKAYSQLHKFQGKSSFSTWLTRIAINEALLMLRNTYRLHEVSFEGSENGNALECLKIQNPKDNLEVSYQEQELRRILLLALKALTPKVRSAIQLRELEERSSSETARILGISVEAVKGRVLHGRKQLRKALESPIGMCLRHLHSQHPEPCEKAKLTAPNP
ncbi:MAG TPA: sigma-70 family RNA polymerase sigma factor [Candidatus Eisenbacteria bacterium]|nr:sigma-70 family RNA polymerase sigma factor [Candidatus Eisenbacteria bacterium]